MLTTGRDDCVPKNERTTVTIRYSFMLFMHLNGNDRVTNALRWKWITSLLKSVIL